MPKKDSLMPLYMLTHMYRKYPQFQQNEIFGLQDAFRKLDVDDRGYLDEATVIKATQTSERQPYDVVRQALKEVDLDSSRRVELDDYVDVRTRPLYAGGAWLTFWTADLEDSKHFSICNHTANDDWEGSRPQQYQ